MNYRELPFISSIFKLFNRGHERSVKAKKNILYSFIIKGIGIAISLFLVPLTIHYINPTRYGVWVTLSSIIGWFAFFDIGLGNGLRNRFAEAVAKGQHELARTYVSTTYAILGIIVLVILVLFWVVNPFLNWPKILNTTPDMALELSRLALIVFVFFCIQFVLQLLNTVITANQEPAKASIFTLVGSLISLILIVILTKTTQGNLVYLGAAFSIAPVVVLAIASVWLYKGQYKRYAPAPGYVKFVYTRDLMNLGIKFFIIQVAFIVIYQTSNIIIAQLFGPAQVTPYNVAYKYFSIVPMVFSIIMTPFWSAFTEAWVKQEYFWIKNIVKNLVRLWILISIGTLIMLAFSNIVYRLWVGKEIVVPFSMSLVIALYVILNSWCSIFSQFLNGVGKIKLQIYSGIFAAIINIPLAIFLGRKIGITGVVLSTTLLAVTSAVWSPIQYVKIINHKAKGIWNK